MQHSIWLIQTDRSGYEAAKGELGGSVKEFYFCSIWHGKCSQTAATKVLNCAHFIEFFFLWICQDEDNQYNKFLNNNPSVNVLF